MKLLPYQSGYNGKSILKSDHEDELEWNMDSSDTDYLVAHGSIEGSIDRARLLLGDLEIALVSGGFPHEVSIDNEAGHRSDKSSFM